MKRTFTLASAAIVALSLTAASVSAADETQDSSSLTRGQFFKQVADDLNLSSSDANIPLPSDVPADSPYAASIRALIDRHILDGYPDGTFRPDQTITKQEAGYVLARFLGLKDSEALEQLKEKFGISFGEMTNVLPDEAKQAVESALVNDEDVKKWLLDSYAKQAEQQTYKARMDQDITVRLAGLAAAAGELNTTVQSDVYFNRTEGIYMRMQMAVPIPGQAQSIDMEHYWTPEGVYMKAPDASAGGEAKWYNVSKQMPYGFEELMMLQESSVSLNATLMNDLFFYRDLGTEQTSSGTKRIIGIYGKIHDYADIVKSLQMSLHDSELQSMLNAGELDGVSMSMNGKLWVDESTQLIEKTEAFLSIDYGSSSSLPIEGIDMTMTAEYTDYNEPVSIVLPEEAKQAEELPAMPASPETTESDAPQAE
jgi:hypothetical protein